MAFISVFGIGSAAPTAGSARSRMLRPAALALLMLLPTTAQAGEVEVQIQGLRNARGLVRLCLTRNPAHFPACDGDPAAVKRSVPAGQAASIRLGDVAPGVYALAVIHDQNGNGRLDTFMGAPREGFGFSRNPPIRMGPPRFDETRFQVGTGAVRQIVQMKHLL